MAGRGPCCVGELSLLADGGFEDGGGFDAEAGEEGGLEDGFIAVGGAGDFRVFGEEINLEGAGFRIHEPEFFHAIAGINFALGAFIKMSGRGRKSFND